MQYPNLYEVLVNDSDAREFYHKLSRGTRDKIKAKPGNITSFQSLMDYVEKCTE